MASVRLLHNSHTFLFSYIPFFIKFFFETSSVGNDRVFYSDSDQFDLREGPLWPLRK